jgi:ribosome hibernation promoting factor
MNINYTGKSDALPPKQREKIETKLRKISKMVERKGEKEAHIIFTQTRFLHKVEITLNAWDHAFVGVGTNGDATKAAHDALEKLDKQIVKLRTKWRDTKRHGKDKEAVVRASEVPAAPVPRGKVAKRAAAAAAAPAKRTGKKVYRVNHDDGSKPMTLEEAMLEMEASQDYMVYRDAETDKVSVLMRRPDGHFDLIES